MQSIANLWFSPRTPLMCIYTVLATYSEGIGDNQAKYCKAKFILDIALSAKFCRDKSLHVLSCPNPAQNKQILQFSQVMVVWITITHKNLNYDHESLQNWCEDSKLAGMVNSRRRMSNVIFIIGDYCLSREETCLSTKKATESTMPSTLQ